MFLCGALLHLVFLFCAYRVCTTVPPTILDFWPTICTCLFHAIRSRLSVCKLRWPNISVLYVAKVGLKRAHRGKLYNLVVVAVVIVVVGDLEASFIIVSANTKLDIKIDTTNDQ